MKKFLFIISLLFIGCETNQNRDNATWSFDSSTGDYLEWQSENDFANEMTNAGFVHLYNVEYEKAKVFFEKALEYDPSLFGPHVVLAGLSPEGSEKSLMHIEKAKENVKDNNETSKLFVSLLDIERQGANWPLISKGAHEIWAKMREIEPKGKLIHFYYAFTVPGYDNKIIEMEKLLLELKNREGDSKSLPTSGDHSYMIGPVINSMGYFYTKGGVMPPWRRRRRRVAAARPGRRAARRRRSRACPRPSRRSRAACRPGSRTRAPGAKPPPCPT